jgi:hypothetical protein
VVRFFVTYDLARSKTGSVKDRMTLEFYFLFIKFPLKFKRTGSTYIFFLLYVFGVFFVQFCHPILYRACFAELVLLNLEGI